MSDSPIERYLDELFVALRTSPPAQARTLLGEAEAHLRDAAADGERRGMSRVDAERDAVDRFGAAARVAAADRDRHPTHVAVRAAVSAVWLGGVAAVAVGVSGVIAGVMHLVGASDEFVGGTRSTAHLSAADCTRWLGRAPHASSCAQAALADWTAETVWYRVGVGLLGVVGLVAFVLARRRWRRARGWAPLPPVVVDTAATTVFGVAGLGLAVLGVAALASQSGHGAGAWLSAAPVALGAAAAFGIRVVRDIRTAT